MISLCMIVKNEEKDIKECILSVKKQLKGVVDDIIVVDTGSTDRTIDIVKELGCRVYDFEWCDDFAAARNFSVSKAKNDWILFLDADESVENCNIVELKNLQKKEFEDIKFKINIRDINKEGVTESLESVPRIFNKNQYDFRGIIHEQLVSKTGKSGRNFNLTFTVKHTGYIADVMHEKGKLERNKKLLLKHLEQHPDDIYIKAHLGLMYNFEKKYEEAIKCLENCIFNEDCINTDYYTVFVIAYIKTLHCLEQFEVAVVCENLWKYCGNNDNYVFYMGISYIRTNRVEKAIEAFLMCINWEGERRLDVKYAYYYLGQIFALLNENEQALICFNNCKGYEDADARIEILLKEKVDAEQ